MYHQNIKWNTFRAIEYKRRSCPQKNWYSIISCSFFLQFVLDTLYSRNIAADMETFFFTFLLLCCVDVEMKATHDIMDQLSY